jgi:serine/threonine protein phosphatase 1
MSASRTFVIGDLHGCVDELNWLLDAIAPSVSDTLVFLGDYIDRGPSPKAVIERVLRLRHEGPCCVFLKGNHEDMLLSYLGYEGRYGEGFLFNGGEATLRSYGVEGQGPLAMAEALPAAHLEFLRSLQMQHSEGPFLCTHAGINPSRPLDAQQEEDLLWIRDEFLLNPHPFPCTVLFGHTPHREVLLDLPYKVGLDTGVVYWNKLSCLELVERQLLQIRRGERTVQRRSLRAPFSEAGVTPG